MFSGLYQVSPITQSIETFIYLIAPIWIFLFFIVLARKGNSRSLQAQATALTASRIRSKSNKVKYRSDSPLNVRYFSKTKLNYQLNENKKVNSSKIRERFLIGIKKGWQTETLPSHIVKLQLNPLIRIFRVLGGISILGIWTKGWIHLNKYALYLAIAISFLYCLYLIYISYNRVLHMYKVFKNKELDVRNSL